MKLLIHAINGIGLGHLIRTSRIAESFEKLRDDSEIVFVTNSRYSQILEKDHKTYALRKDTRDVIEGKCTYDEYLKFNTRAISKIIFHERPDAVLFDCELNRELVVLCRRNSIKCIFVLRVPAPERFSEIKSDLALFDGVVVPHHEDEMPSEQRNFLRKLGAVFAGPIVDTFTCSANTERKNILITFGSGANIPDNLPLFSAVDSFLNFLRESNSSIDGQRINLDIVTGPFYDGGCDLGGFAVRTTSDSLAKDMCQAKIVISGAGYNTINEIISTKTPAVVVPLRRKWDDQFRRAEFYDRLGCLKICSKEILEDIRNVLDNWQGFHDRFPLIHNGNRKAAEAVIAVCNSKTNLNSLSKNK
ncbi:MAG: glycosyltransferase [Candidatus Omnitrophota bacterium]